jgi:hypothetical protein
MKLFTLLVLISFFLAGAATTTSSATSRIDPAFFGVWKLNVTKSDFGSKPGPRSGVLNWTERGWVIAMVSSDGSITGSAVGTENGCVLIGAEKNSWCKLSIPAPKHVLVFISQGCDSVGITDMELLDRNTARTINRTYREDGKDVVESTFIWNVQR